MHASQLSPLTSLFDSGTQPSYEVRVRATPSGPTYLWGSAGVTGDITFPKPLLLHFRNDVFGEPVTFGTQLASGAQTTMGTLQPGEAMSIPVQGISGVFATCDVESTVSCMIKESA